MRLPLWFQTKAGFGIQVGKHQLVRWFVCTTLAENRPVVVEVQSEDEWLQALDWLRPHVADRTVCLVFVYAHDANTLVHVASPAGPRCRMARILASGPSPPTVCVIASPVGGDGEPDVWGSC